jgi:hypothetical protein
MEVCCQRILDSPGLPYDELFWVAKYGLFDVVEALMSRGFVQKKLALCKSFSDFSGSKRALANQVVHNTLRFVVANATILPCAVLSELVIRCFCKSRYNERMNKEDIPSELKKTYLKPADDGDKSFSIWARMPV